MIETKAVKNKKRSIQPRADGTPLTLVKVSVFAKRKFLEAVYKKYGIGNCYGYIGYEIDIAFLIAAKRIRKEKW